MVDNSTGKFLCVMVCSAIVESAENLDSAIARTRPRITKGDSISTAIPRILDVLNSLSEFKSLLSLKIPIASKCVNIYYILRTLENCTAPFSFHSCPLVYFSSPLIMGP